MTTSAPPEPVPLVCIADENVVAGLLAMLASARLHLRPNAMLHAHVVDAGLSSASREVVAGRLQSMHNMQVQFHTVPPDYLDQFPASPYYSKVVWLKPLAIDLLADIDLAIYSDVDVLIRTDLAIWLTAPLQSMVIGAVPDWNAILAQRIDARVIEECSALPCAPYFNNGILLLNLHEWRRRAVSEAILNVARDHGSSLRYPEQDAMNIVLQGQWKLMAPSFNTLFPLPDAIPRRVPFFPRSNLHFVGVRKPWQFRRRHASGAVALFYRYLDRANASYVDCPGASRQYPSPLRRAIPFIRHVLARQRFFGPQGDVQP